jgi:uncharacterized membrane protein YphA (DoxX/SURF4 family)
MRARTVGYWITTIVIAFAFLSGGAAYLARQHDTVEGMTHLGYPLYFLTLLGLWKLLGGIALLVPRFPRLKEWAYAGIFFDLTGATWSHAAAGDDLRHVVVPLVLAAILIASWALRPPSRVLGEIRPGAPRAGAA